MGLRSLRIRALFTATLSLCKVYHRSIHPVAEQTKCFSQNEKQPKTTLKSKSKQKSISSQSSVQWSDFGKVNRFPKVVSKGTFPLPYARCPPFTVQIWAI